MQCYFIFLTTYLLYFLLEYYCLSYPKNCVFHLYLCSVAFSCAIACNLFLTVYLLLITLDFYISLVSSFCCRIKTGNENCKIHSYLKCWYCNNLIYKNTRLHESETTETNYYLYWATRKNPLRWALPTVFTPNKLQISSKECKCSAYSLWPVIHYKRGSQLSTTLFRIWLTRLVWPQMFYLKDKQQPPA